MGKVRGGSRGDQRPDWYWQQQAEAYRLCRAVTERATRPDLVDASRYRGIPLVPLLQRPLTERFMAALTQDERESAPSLSHGRVGGIDGRSEQIYHLFQSFVRDSLYVPRIAQLRRRWQQLAPLPLDPAPVLFHPFFPNHLPSFLPVIQELQRRGKYRVMVAGADSNTLRRGDVDPSPLDGLGVPYLPFEGAASTRKVAESMARATILPARLGHRVRSAGFLHGLGLEEGKARLAQAVLAPLLEQQLPKIVLYIDLAYALYRKLRPAVVVVTDETLPVIGRVALRTAQQEGIATLTIQHGLLLEDPMYFGPAVAERYAIWGEQSRTFLQTHGCPPEQLVEVGSTRLGPPPHDLVALDLSALLGLPAQTRILLVTSQPGGRDVSSTANETTMVALAQAATALPECHLLLKPHPAQSNRELEHLEAAVREKVTDAPLSIRRDLPLHETMLGAALTITTFSTTGLEALWLDRPLLMVNLTGRPDLIRYGEGGAAVVAHKREEVPARLRQALNPEDQAARKEARARFVSRYLGRLDGEAPARTADLIDSLAEGKG